MHDTEAKSTEAESAYPRHGFRPAEKSPASRIFPESSGVGNASGLHQLNREMNREIANTLTNKNYIRHKVIGCNASAHCTFLFNI